MREDLRAGPAKEPRRRKVRSPAPGAEAAVREKEPVHGQPPSPSDDVHVRIARRAYEIYLERGSRPGYALSDWLEAEREILGSECQA